MIVNVTLSSDVTTRLGCCAKKKKKKKRTQIRPFEKMETRKRKRQISNLNVPALHQGEGGCVFREKAE